MTTQTHATPLNIGLDDNARAGIAHGLAVALAGTHALGLKAQNFHWNVTGARFQSLHALFEDQYADLSGATDALAERIRALGVFAPGSLGQFATLSPIGDAPDTPQGADAMLNELARDHDTLSRTLRTQIGDAADVGDEATADLLTGRLAAHEKAGWMLRASVA